MTRWSRAVVVLALASSGCATYGGDLDRAAVRYNNNEYEHALLLLEVLERDIDALSTQELARYSYFRGMAHYRLNQRRDARHWLGVAAALDEENAGSLDQDELKRTTETLADLNREVYQNGTGAAAPRCERDADCGPGRFCDGGQCNQTPSESEMPRD